MKTKKAKTPLLFGIVEFYEDGRVLRIGDTKQINGAVIKLAKKLKKQ